MDKQANRRARSGPGATLNQGRLNGSQGVTTFLKVTGPAVAAVMRQPAWMFDARVKAGGALARAAGLQVWTVGEG